MADGSQTLSLQDDSNFDPTEAKTGDNDPSEVDSDKDVVSLDALTQEELQYIVNNSRYKNILSDILSPFVEEMSEAGSVRSADPTVTDDQSEKGTSPVVYKLANTQGEGADTSSSQAKKKALKRPSEGDPSPSKKR